VTYRLPFLLLKPMQRISFSKSEDLGLAVINELWGLSVRKVSLELSTSSHFLNIVPSLLISKIFWFLLSQVWYDHLSAKSSSIPIFPGFACTTNLFIIYWTQQKPTRHPLDDDVVSLDKPSWMSEARWRDLLHLISRYPVVYKGLARSISSRPKLWQEYFDYSPVLLAKVPSTQLHRKLKSLLLIIITAEEMK